MIILNKNMSRFDLVVDASLNLIFPQIFGVVSLSVFLSVSLDPS